ncbi:hypothetical protein BFP97_04915 [Roseivirga sp. 4D4]|uniref:DUF3570 domain-containing protein n=1 Tax=Roseivirga sp. 4D4 TaxID=1889784 RepID=UPI000853EBF9|nr:DUF3570 domain-containing protein [Roseivirga sp. 4D4]OEK00890.1 hypothetical protein BFP97_04915 [Roseivirga sp. 4D4]
MRLQLRGVFFLALLSLVTAKVAAQREKSETDTTGFEIKKLAESDISLLFSYYTQDGNNSPVTGGLGTEQLTDLTSKVIVNLVLDEKNTVSFDGGFDMYSSASTDNIDDFVSSASSKDTRVHANFGYSRKAKNDLTWGLKLGGSTEYDYNSFQFSGYVSKTSRDGNRTFGLAGQAFIDRWEIIYPRELRDRQWVTTDQRRSYSVSASFSTVINRRVQASISADVVAQSGLLSTPFHRVYFTNQTEARVERLPFNRLKIPVGLRLNYYVNDLLLLRSYYRFYWDDWGITGHTIALEASVKLNRFFSVYPFYRYHTQSEANYFAPFGEHTGEFQYYTSDYDLSNLSSHQYGIGLRYSPADGIGRLRLPGRNNRLLTLKEINLKYGHYTRTPSLSANIFSIGMNLSF